MQADRAEEGVWKNEIVFFVNGAQVVLDRVDPTTSVAEFLRDEISLTATKVGCGSGLCGN
jgi:xanthine dehydrogenase iron-sulfur cluster and FAD-binding subunit A